MNTFLNFAANVGLAWCFCVGAYCVGKHGYESLRWAVNRAFDVVIPPPPGEE